MGRDYEPAAPTIPRWVEGQVRMRGRVDRELAAGNELLLNLPPTLLQNSVT